MSGSCVGSPSWITGREELVSGLTSSWLHAGPARETRRRVGARAALPPPARACVGLHSRANSGGLIPPKTIGPTRPETGSEATVSSTAGGGTSQQAPATTEGGPAARLGFTVGTVVQELGWDNDTDDDLRVAVEDAIDADMVDGDYGNVVDAVILWWRDDDGDLVDGLVDALTDLVGGGAIWLLTPKIGRSGAVDPAEIAEAAPLAGLAQTTTAAVSNDWAATRLVAPKTVG